MYIFYKYFNIGNTFLNKYQISNQKYVFVVTKFTVFYNHHIFNNVLTLYRMSY